MTASGDAAMTKVPHNCAPALSNDGSLLYVGISNGTGTGDASGNSVAIGSTVGHDLKVATGDGTGELGNDIAVRSSTVGHDLTITRAFPNLEFESRVRFATPITDHGVPIIRFVPLHVLVEPPAAPQPRRRRD